MAALGAKLSVLRSGALLLEIRKNVEMTLQLGIGQAWKILKHIIEKKILDYLEEPYENLFKGMGMSTVSSPAPPLYVEAGNLFSGFTVLQMEKKFCLKAALIHAWVSCLLACPINFRLVPPTPPAGHVS